MTPTAPSLWTRWFGPSRADRAEARQRELLAAFDARVRQERDEAHEAIDIVRADAKLAAERAEALHRETLAVLREDRAALTAVLTKALDNAEAQTALTRAQYDLLTAPVGEAQVRLMTPAIEAQYERDRMVAATVPASTTPLSPDKLLADLAKDFSSLSLQ